MAHKRKKAGERKDKKTARMREAEEFKKGMQSPDKPTSDQDDVQTHKPGHASDKSAPQNLAKSKTKKKAFVKPPE